MYKRQRYTLLKLVALVITVAIGVYITILVANMGGAVDKMRMAMIRESVALAATADPAFKNLSSAQRIDYINQRVELEAERFGLDRPFFIRSLEFLRDGMTLNLGYSQQLMSDSGSRLVRNILLERLPSTLLLFGTANLILFFIALFAGLRLSRRYGSFADKTVLALAPTSAAPRCTSCWRASWSTRSGPPRPSRCSAAA